MLSLSRHQHPAASSVSNSEIRLRYAFKISCGEKKRNVSTDLLHVYSKQVTPVHVRACFLRLPA